MTYLNTMIHTNGILYYLRGTTFTEYKDRATRYPTVEAAAAAITTASKFHPKRMMKSVSTIVEN